MLYTRVTGFVRWQTFTVELHQKQVRIPDTAESVELFIYDCSGKDIYREVLRNVVSTIERFFAMW